jgi:putative thioredoxin
MHSSVVDVDEQNFQQEVVERSKTVPIVIDFWAPWCGPCRVLGPILERLADELAGKFVLAKVNVDENPQLAASFGAQSIPLVVAVRDGAIIGDFVGALPEPAIREHLTRWLPSPAEELITRAEASLRAGNSSEADALLQQALEINPRADRALYLQAQRLADQNRDDEAQAVLERIAPGSPVAQDVDRLAAALRIRRAGGGDTTALRARVEANPDDLDARFELAQMETASGNYQAGLDQYLEIIKRDRAYRDDGARKAMLDVFDLLGPGNELTDRYRSELARVLFR